MKQKTRKNKSLEAMRQRYNYVFMLPWLIGLLLFFITPLIKSIWYAFCEVRIEPGTIISDYIGTANFKSLIYEDPDFLNKMFSSMGYVLYSIPLIIAFSLGLAVILNSRFFGRTFMRVLFFLPVVLTASVVLKILSSASIRMPLFQTDQALNYSLIVENLNIPEGFRVFVEFILKSAITIIYNSAVQIILFMGGLQSIPSTLYEASEVEGTNKWEEFWLITVPSLRHVISLVIVYTMIDLFTNKDNLIVQDSYNGIVTQRYGESSAMLWFYFSIVIVIIGIVYALYHRFAIKWWE